MVQEDYNSSHSLEVLYAQSAQHLNVTGYKSMLDAFDWHTCIMTQIIL